MSDCPINGSWGHNLHGGLLVEPDSLSVALCRDCRQIIDENGDVMSPEEFTKMTGKVLRTL